MQTDIVTYLCWVFGKGWLVGAPCVGFAFKLLPDTVSRGTASLCTEQTLLSCATSMHAQEPHTFFTILYVMLIMGPALSTSLELTD